MTRDGSNLIGSSPTRAEDPDLVRGASPYVADLRVPGCLEAAFVRSYAAYGTITSIDASGATEMDGVVGVWSASDLPDLPDMPRGTHGGVPPEMARPSLAKDRVRFAGEAIAVVIGETRYSAEDGAERVLVEIDPLDAVLEPTDPENAPALFEGHGNVASVHEMGTPVDDVMADAPVVVTTELRNDRLAPTSIEPRAILVDPSDGRLTVWVSHQAPQRLRRELAGAFALEPDSVRVIVPKVGGAFGGKSQTFPEYIAVAHIARLLERPVRWVEDRREALLGSTHGRGQRQRLRMASDNDGHIHAVEALIDADVGAYPHTGGFVAANTGWLMSGPYRIPRIYARVRAVVTNATPTAAYRGAGRPEATFALERLIEKLAIRLELDPAEVRLRNFIDPSEFPYNSPTGAVYDSGDHASVLRKALELVGYDELRGEQRRRSAAGENPIGIGIGSYVERAGGQPGSMEFGAIEVIDDGTVVARSGSTPQGQGHATAFGLVVATAFDVDFDRVRVVQGDTDEVPSGTGTFGSRSMQVGGAALQKAAGEVLDAARERAGAMLEVSSEDLEYGGGRFTITGTDRSIGLGELASEGPLAAETEFAPPQAFPFGTYVAVVELDRATGDVRLTRIVAVDDCGVVVHPKIVEGQIVGSMVQGIGQALYEVVSYDEDGQPQSSSLMDYSLPTAAEIPEVVIGHNVTPNPHTALGAKGAGETGCIGAPPAIVNAIMDALGGPDEELDMPVTPEKVWRALTQPA